MKILTDAQGNQFTVADESALSPYVPGKKATVLKSARTDQGAADFLKILGHKYPGAVIVKSLDGYADVSYAGPSSPQMPVHVVMEESMTPVVETVSVKNSDEMFRAMFKKGLLQVGSGGIFPTDKFYTLLGQFVEQTFNDIMKSVTPEEEKNEDGSALIDTLGDAMAYLKSVAPSVGGGAEAREADGVGPEKRPAGGGKGDTVPDLALSQEEADNKHGEYRTHASPEDGTGSEARPAGGSDGDTVPNLALSQEEADNKNAGIVAISDAEAKSKFGSIQYMKSADDTYLFKSYGDFVAGTRKSTVKYDGRPTNLDERNKHGRKWSYAAVELPAEEPVGRWGNKKRGRK